MDPLPLTGKCMCAHVVHGAQCCAARDDVSWVPARCAEERPYRWFSLDDRAACVGGHGMLSEARRTFYAEAASTIAAGLLTEHERDVIARVGTRKACYWSRHLDDLRSVLTRRLAERDRRSAYSAGKRVAEAREREGAE